MPAPDSKNLEHRLATALGAERYPSVPEILELAAGEGELRVKLRVDGELPCFRGHFPGNPVLPGVLQLQWAVELARLEFGFSHPPRQVLRLKFRSIVVPPECIELQLTRGDGVDVHFSYTSASGTHSQGIMRFERHGR